MRGKMESKDEKVEDVAVKQEVMSRVDDITTSAVETAQTSKPKGSVAKRVGLGCVMVAGGVAILMGGMALNQVLLRKDVAGNTLGVGEEINEDTALGSATGEALKNVVLLREDDQLTLSLLRMHNEPVNSCYSPLSIRYALEMLRAGADGETKTQIDKILGNATIAHYDNVAEHLGLANALWVVPAWDSVFLSSYREALRNDFGAEVKVDEFQSAANINSWIESNSLGMLQNVLQDAEVQGLNAALVNVLSVDMDWKKEYDKWSTSGQFFNFDDDNLEDNKYYNTMRIYTRGTQNDGGLYYNLADEATVFAQDLKEYNGTHLQYVAIMPDDLNTYVANVTNEDINVLLEGLHEAKAQNSTYEYSLMAYMPRFEIDGGIENLLDDLRALGVEDAFDSTKANFSKMLSADNFAINAATHKTKFALSEEGIKAAAVTIVGGYGSGGGPRPIPSSVSVVISINKPFMYLVRDVETGEIWFLGTVYEPELSENQPTW